ncbi:MAG: acetyl/propionyl/methylcrotonyl-CoA carboxylase subunit alpha [Xanthobacteraceae bacterium]
MFGSVLIANRGEIACRVARTARRLGMRTVAVYSAADARALHVRVCDESYLLGPAEPRESYLSIERLVETAKRANVECVHPGYGFLSENADFAEACTSAGLVFVGPPAAAIRAMGLKDRAKTLIEAAGVPIVPGYHGERQDGKFLKETAYRIGYPVLIKPAAGGGGRGLRRVERHADFDAALEAAARESEAAFGSSRVLIEKYVAAPRHIEIQIFADRHGNVIHLGERDCSLQRRHQKIIEETPAPGMTDELRAQMGAAAVEAARAVGYEGAGTVEFVADSTQGLRSGAFWFIEMNTRLQVEHPLTEAVTGIDLVDWQFRVAAGERLPRFQEQIRLSGHAVEARVYAEDPESGFLPSTGLIVALQWHGDVRIESGVEAGDEVTRFYDPMIAKVIAHAPTRLAAIEQLAHAIDGTLIAGPRSNLAFLGALCRSSAFQEGRVDTGFVDRSLAALGAVPRQPDGAAAALGVERLLDRAATGIVRNGAARDQTFPSPWAARDAFQLGGSRILAIPVVIDGANADATVRYGQGGASVSVGGESAAADAQVFVTGEEAFVLHCGRQTRVRITDFSAVGAAADTSDGVIKAPMHGKVLQIFVGLDERVAVGASLATIEAMKMEHTLHAPFAGIVRRIAVAAGAQVVEGGEIMVIDPAAAR